MTTVAIAMRDARDRVIDLLGFGESYPLQDLDVPDAKLTVPYNTTAKIEISNSQAGVLYQLHYKEQVVKRRPDGSKGGSTPIEAYGTGGTLILETYKIDEDITFDIFARKQISGNAAYLHQTATIKVGLNDALKAWIRSTPHLDPMLKDSTDAMPRIIFYNEGVEVEIEDSQEGVDYRLVSSDDPATWSQPLSKQDVRGNLQNIILETSPFQEDAEIYVLATKTFDPQEQKEAQTAILRTVLPLKVRANPALDVSVHPTPIIDFGNATNIRIADTQASAGYRIYAKPIADTDFVRIIQPEPEENLLTVHIPNETDVKVRAPARANPWALPSGFIALGGDALPGTGGVLDIPTSSLVADSLIIVQAEKAHRVSLDPQNHDTLNSGVQLQQAVVALVRPNAEPELTLRAVMNNNITDGELHVYKGEPGVFYHFDLLPDKRTLGLPAYFHKRDALDENINKGTSQLAIEVDFVIQRSFDSTMVVVNPASIPAQSPIVETGPIPSGSTLQVRATKAQTRVAKTLGKTARVETLPVIRLEETEVQAGATTRIFVESSIQGDRYQPFLDGEAVKSARNGNGGNLTFVTGAITADSEFEVIVTRPDDTGIPVQRVVKLQVFLISDDYDD